MSEFFIPITVKFTSFKTFLHNYWLGTVFKVKIGAQKCWLTLWHVLQTGLKDV